MKCKRHPSCECPRGQSECFLCGDGAHIENDKFKFQYELMARHVDRNAVGIRTRGQYQRLLKRKGLTDDVTYKELRTLTLDTGKRERIREEKIRSYLEKMTPELSRRTHQVFRQIRRG